MHIIEELRTQFQTKGVSLVAVSKTRSDDQIMELYQLGQRIFGENRVQELVGKYERLPKDIQWHLIGHLQTNKVKQIAPFIDLIHSIDSLKLLKEVNKQAQSNDRIINVLLQMHIAEEEAKYGLKESDLQPIFEHILKGDLPNIKAVGLMGMATYTSDEAKISAEFGFLQKLFDKVKANPAVDEDFTVLSMGMSGDYKIAIQEGANMVRIGSLLFR
jgi:pyridoxal phosphate enzyme (YggS family)